MANFDEKQLKQHIRTKEFYSAYLFIGDESYLKQLYVGMIADAAVDKAFQSFNSEQFDGKGLDLKDVFERAALMPMMSERRCIIVDDYKLEPVSEKDLKILTSSLENLPESTVLIFRQDSNPVTRKGGKKVISLFEKYGAVCELNKRTGSDLYKPLISSASKQGSVLSTAMAQYLVSCVGDDFNVLINELQKVCSYAGETEITKEHIDAVVVKTLDAKVNYLIRALIANDFEKAYSVLDTLLAQKTEPGYIIGSIIGTYVDMYRAKVAMTCEGRVQPILDTFNYKGREFSLNYAARDCAKLDLWKIRGCIDELIKTDTKLKTSGENPTLIIEQLMVKLLLISNGEKVC